MSVGFEELLLQGRGLVSVYPLIVHAPYVIAGRRIILDYFPKFN